MNAGAAVAATVAGAAVGASVVALAAYSRRERIEAAITARAVRWVSARVGMPELAGAGQLALRLLR